MFEIERDFVKAEKTAPLYRKEHPNLNSIGVLRSTLRIANPNYTKAIENSDGTIIDIKPERLKKYRLYDLL
jgi:hypothetical protein